MEFALFALLWLFERRRSTLLAQPKSEDSACDFRQYVPPPNLIFRLFVLLFDHVPFPLFAGSKSTNLETKISKLLSGKPLNCCQEKLLPQHCEVLSSGCDV